jgi:hypothetical protein
MTLPDIKQIETYIRQQAAAMGINPDIAVQVAKSEGLADGVWQSNLNYKGDREQSYGPFQLFMGGGLGNEFQDKFGKSPADPSSWMDQVTFSLGKAKEGGWAPWHGAKRVGLDRWAGIKAGAPAARTASVGPVEGLGGNASPEAAYTLPSTPQSPSQGPGAAVEPGLWDYISGNRKAAGTAAQDLGGAMAGMDGSATPALDPRKSEMRRMGDLSQIQPTSYTRRKQPSIYDLIAQGGY